jgi:DNA primase
MALTERISPYAERLIDDRELRENLREVLSASRDAALRARGQDKKRAVRDHRVRRRARDAATAGSAVIAALREPPPKPKGNRFVLIALLGAAATAAFLALNPGARAQVMELLGQQPEGSAQNQPLA